MAEAAPIALPHVDPAALAGMIDPTTTALVVIDIQRDFAAPDGLIGRHGAPMAAAEAAVDRIEELIATARSAGVTLAFMRVVTSPDTDSEALKALYARKGRPGGHAICRTEDGGADYHRVQPEPGDIEIAKTLYDSFHGTDLEQQLRERGVETLVITGLSTDCCVDATTRAAFHRNFHVFVVSDACAAYDPAMHAGALAALEKNCALLTTSDAVAATWTREVTA